jgi:hypothetical protein
VSTVANFSTTVIDQVYLSQSKYQVPGGILSTGVQYYWRSRARNAGGWSPWASAWNFTTTIDPPTTPVLLSPTNGSSATTTPLLDWNDVTSATSYRLQVSTVANFSTTVIDQVYLFQSKYQVPGGILSTGVQYYWRARAKNAGGWSPWVSAWNFITTINPPTIPVLVSPANGSTVLPIPLLDWDDVETATRYRVQVSTVANFSTTVIDQVYLTQSKYQVPAGILSSFTQYYWRARAMNDGGWGPWASAWSFTTSESIPTTPVLLTPSDGSIVSPTPLLDWEDVATATSYRLQVSEVANFITTVIDEVALTESQYQVPEGILITDALISNKILSRNEIEVGGVLMVDNVQYYWRVRARNAGGWSPWVSAWSFTTSLPLTPVLLSPSNSSYVTPTPLLDWEDGVAATRYRLQVSTDPHFFTTVIDLVSLTPSQYQVPGGVLSDSTEYFWRVRGRNTVGWSPWASAWSFNTTIAKPTTPVLQSPANGSTVTTTPLLNWGDVSTATSYRLQVTTDPQFFTTVIDEITLTESQYQVPGGVLSPGVQYYWRARARNAGGWSPWASAWNFTTQSVEGNTTDLSLYSIEIPSEFNLHQNFPNPFNPVTKIKFDIASPIHVKIKVFDIIGREIKTLTDQILQAGRYEFLFSASNLPSGVYFYRLETGDFVNIKRMIILK